MWVTPVQSAVPHKVPWVLSGVTHEQEPGVAPEHHRLWPKLYCALQKISRGKNKYFYMWRVYCVLLCIVLLFTTNNFPVGVNLNLRKTKLNKNTICSPNQQFTQLHFQILASQFISATECLSELLEQNHSLPEVLPWPPQLHFVEIPDDFRLLLTALHGS